MIIDGRNQKLQAARANRSQTRRNSAQMDLTSATEETTMSVVGESDAGNAEKRPARDSRSGRQAIDAVELENSALAPGSRGASSPLDESASSPLENGEGRRGRQCGRLSVGANEPIAGWLGITPKTSGSGSVPQQDD